MRRALWMLLLVLAVATGAAAQKVEKPKPVVMFQHGSSINLFTGAATAPSMNAAIGGAGVGWELTPRFGVEASGQWLDWNSSRHGFAMAVATQTGIGGTRAFMPFVSAGLGLYHVDFDRPEFGMPAFYTRRMLHGARTATVARFTDPTAVFGGGVNAFVSRHWAIRPDVQEIAVLRDARAYWMTTFAFHLAYHFEEHPITPRAR